MKQDAVQTFVFLKAGRELKKESNALLMLDLSDVAYIPSQAPKYQSDLKLNYKKRLGYETRPANQVSLTDPNLEHVLSKILPGG